MTASQTLIMQILLLAQNVVCIKGRRSWLAMNGEGEDWDKGARVHILEVVVHVASHLWFLSFVNSLTQYNI